MFGLFNRKRSMAESGLLKGAVDSHCHVLYGLDDGVKTYDEATDILGFLHEQGVNEVWFTPHVMEDVPNTTEGIKARFQEFLGRYSGPVKFQLGAEYMLDNLYEARLAARDLLLHGADRVLVETSILAPPIDLWGTLERTMKAGYRPLLAHPERYRYMTPKDYERLSKMGVLLQMNIPSLVGFYGKDAQQKARYLLEKDMYCMVGSDCHRYHAIIKQDTAPQLSKQDIRHLEPIMKGLPNE